MSVPPAGFRSPQKVIKFPFVAGFSLCRAGVAAHRSAREEKLFFFFLLRKTEKSASVVGKCRGKSAQLGNSLFSHLGSGFPEEFLDQLGVQHCWDRSEGWGSCCRKDPKPPTLRFSCSSPSLCYHLVWHKLFPTWANNKLESHAGCARKGRFPSRNGTGSEEHYPSHIPTPSMFSLQHRSRLQLFFFWPPPLISHPSIPTKWKHIQYLQIPALSEELLSLRAPHITGKTFVFAIRRGNPPPTARQHLRCVCLTVFLPCSKAHPGKNGSLSLRFNGLWNRPLMQYAFTHIVLAEKAPEWDKISNQLHLPHASVPHLHQDYIWERANCTRVCSIASITTLCCCILHRGGKQFIIWGSFQLGSNWLRL